MLHGTIGVLEGIGDERGTVGVQEHYIQKSWAVSRDQLRPVMFGKNGNHGDASEITGNHGELISGRVSARNRRVGELEGKRTKVSVN